MSSVLVMDQTVVHHDHELEFLALVLHDGDQLLVLVEDLVLDFSLVLGLFDVLHFLLKSLKLLKLVSGIL